MTPLDLPPGGAAIRLLGLALIHFAWQGAAVAAVCALLLHELRGASARRSGCSSWI